MADFTHKLNLWKSLLTTSLRSSNIYVYIKTLPAIVLSNPEVIVFYHVSFLRSL